MVAAILWKRWVKVIFFIFIYLNNANRTVITSTTKAASLGNPKLPSVLIFLSYFVVVQLLSCVQLCDTTDCNTPGFPVLHHLLEFAQTPVHWVGDAIQPFGPLSPPSPALNLSQHQSFPMSRFLANYFQHTLTLGSSRSNECKLFHWGLHLQARPLPQPTAHKIFTDLESRVPENFQESSTVSSENSY